MLASAPRASAAATSSERLIQRHIRLAGRIARRYHAGRSPDAAVSASAMRGLARAADSYDPAIDESFEAYAVPIIVHELKAHYRRDVWSNPGTPDPALTDRILEALAEHGEMTAQDLALVLEVALEEIVDTLGLIDSSEIAAALGRPGTLRAGHELSGRERLIFDLCYGCDLSVADIAATLGIGVSRVRTLLGIAVRELYATTLIQRDSVPVTATE